MPRYKLIVQPDGRYVLVSPDRMDERETEHFMEQWKRAQEDQHGLAIIPDCEVIILEREPDR